MEQSARLCGPWGCIRDAFPSPVPGFWAGSEAAIMEGELVTASRLKAKRASSQEALTRAPSTPQGLCSFSCCTCTPHGPG